MVTDLQAARERTLVVLERCLLTLTAIDIALAAAPTQPLSVCSRARAAWTALWTRLWVVRLIPFCKKKSELKMTLWKSEVCTQLGVSCKGYGRIANLARYYKRKKQTRRPQAHSSP